MAGWRLPMVIVHLPWRYGHASVGIAAKRGARKLSCEEMAERGISAIHGLCSVRTETSSRFTIGRPSHRPNGRSERSSGTPANSTSRDECVRLLRLDRGQEGTSTHPVANSCPRFAL